MLIHIMKFYKVQILTESVTSQFERINHRDFVKTLGEGLPPYMITNNAPIDYVNWDDPNVLVDHLRLLMAERYAGNPSHDNEIQSIIEELQEAEIIYWRANCF